MSKIALTLDFCWIPVLKNPQGDKYFFPENRSSYMRRQYLITTVYRWMIYKNKDDLPKKKSVYIGETINLYQRIGHILKPGDRPGNLKLNSHFGNLIAKGFHIIIDILEISSLLFNDELYDFSNGLDLKWVRSGLESLLIMNHQYRGYNILNSPNKQ